MNHNQWLKANPRDSSRGAPMGHFGDELDPGVPVHVEMLDLVDGGYARDGTYYGLSSVTRVFAIWQEVGGERRAMYARFRYRHEAVACAIVAGFTPLRGATRKRRAPCRPVDQREVTT